MKKKIFFLVNIDSFLVSHRLLIAKKLLKNGFEVHIGTEFTKYEKKLIKFGFKTHHVNFNRNSFNLYKAIIALIQIFFLFRRIKPDLVHLISIKPIIFGGLLSFISPIKNLVVSITGLGSVFIKDSFVFKLRRNLFKFLYTIIFFRSNLKVIIQNKDDLSYLIDNCNLDKKKAKIIKGSGVDLNLFKYSQMPKGVPIILMASRIIKDKGVFEFVQSAEYLKNKNFKGKFYLIGDIDLENPSAIKKSLIKKWKNEKTVKIIGHSSIIYKFMKKSSIIILPSYREGFPKVLMEASACGRPIITTNVPGCRDAIINNKTGILVPPKNSLALAKAIITLSSNKMLLKKMGKAGRIHAKKNFNINIVVSKHLGIYKKLLSN